MTTAIFVALLGALDTFMNVQNRNILLLAHNYVGPPRDTSFVRNILVKGFLTYNCCFHSFILVRSPFRNKG
jgi:hypothetical protein